MSNLVFFKDKVDYYLEHLSDDGFMIQVNEIAGDLILKLWKGTEQFSYRNSHLFNWSEISDDIHRFLINIFEYFELTFIYVMSPPNMGEHGHGDGITLYRRVLNIDQVNNDNIGQIKSFNLTFRPKDIINESINIDRFKNFIKKYKKTEYISKSLIKNMIDEIGINYNDYKKVSDSVNACISFLKNLMMNCYMIYYSM